MKRKWTLAVALLLVFCTFCGLTASAKVDEQPETKNVIHGDVLDVYPEKTISDDVDGDLIFAAANATVNGNVAGSIRAAAMILELNGTVSRNLTVAGMTVTTGRKFVMKSESSASIAGGTVLLYGTFGDLSVSGSEVYVMGSVQGQLKIDADRVYLVEGLAVESGSTIETSGDVILLSPDAARMDNGSVTYSGGRAIGETELRGMGIALDTSSNDTAFPALAALTVFSALTQMLLALFLCLVLRGENKTANAFREHKVRFVLSGLLLFLLLPLAAVFLLFPMVTIVIALVLLLIYVLVMLCSTALTAVVIVKTFLPAKNQMLFSVLIASGISILGSLPLVGGLVSFACGAIALGWLWCMLFGKADGPLLGTPGRLLDHQPQDNFRV